MKVIHGKKACISIVAQYAKEHGGQLLSSEYNNALEILTWQCKYNHIFNTTFNHVKNRKQWCPVCGKVKSAISIAKTMKNPKVREKISKSHIKRLNKMDRFCGKTHREIASTIRDHTAGLFRNKKKHQTILPLIGCSFEYLKQHIESKFEPGMSWENRGFYGWHIDHIKPLSCFDLQDLEQRKLACHYTNLQPLWAKDNGSKGCKYE